jgi:hypothetical protein
MSVAAPHQTVATDPLTTSETASADRPLPTVDLRQQTLRERSHSNHSQLYP